MNKIPKIYIVYKQNKSFPSFVEMLSWFFDKDEAEDYAEKREELFPDCIVYVEEVPGQSK